MNDMFEMCISRIFFLYASYSMIRAMKTDRKRKRKRERRVSEKQSQGGREGGGKKEGRKLKKQEEQNQKLLYSECQNGNSLCKVLQKHKCNRFILTRYQSTVCLRNLSFFNFLIYFWMVTF